MSDSTPNSNNNFVYFHSVGKERLAEVDLSTRSAIFHEGLPLRIIDLEPENHVIDIMVSNFKSIVRSMLGPYGFNGDIDHFTTEEGELIFKVTLDSERDYRIPKINLPF